MTIATAMAQWAAARRDMTTTTMVTGDDDDRHENDDVDANYTTMAEAQAIRQQQWAAWWAAREGGS